MKKMFTFIAASVSMLQAAEVYATFTVEALKSANLAFSSSGIVDEVLVDVATEVKKDQILVKLQSGDIQAMIDTSKTNLFYAKREYDRQLQIKNIIDKSKLDSYALNYDKAKNQLAYEEELMDKTILKAPFDGVIVSKSVEAGDVVSGAMIRTIMQIESIDAQKLVMNIDQKYWKQIKVGQKFRYKVDGDSKSYEGTISKIYPSANQNNRKLTAEVNVTGFVTGLYGEGYIDIPDQK